MKKIYLALLSLALILPATGNAFARDIIIVNACDFPLKSISLVKKDSNKAYNMLKKPLAPQEAIKISMKDEGQTWNVLAEDPANSIVTFENIAFDGINQIHIQADGTVEIYR